jgi:hypothetical protein
MCYQNRTTQFAIDSLATPKAVDIATSAASLPRPMTTRPAEMDVARVYGVPTTIEKDFGPAAEIHCLNACSGVQRRGRDKLLSALSPNGARRCAS